MGKPKQVLWLLSPVPQPLDIGELVSNLATYFIKMLPYLVLYLEQLPTFDNIWLDRGVHGEVMLSVERLGRLLETSPHLNVVPADV